MVDSPPEFAPPQTKIVDFADIDVMLISNYLCMLALPFITEGTGFSGVVYCTEPTMQIGRSVSCILSLVKRLGFYNLIINLNAF